VNNRLAYLLAGVTAAAAAGVLSGYRPATVVAGLLLAFVLPGAALTGALFADRRQLAPTERIMLVPALSLAALVIGGLCAWALGAKLDRTTWLVLSAGITAAGLVVSVVRTARRGVQPVPVPPVRPPAAPVPAAAGDQGVRVKLPTREDPTLILPVFLDRDGIFARDSSPWDRPAVRRVVRELLPLVLVGVLAGGASWLSVVTSVRTHDVTVTALSVAPPAATTADGKRVVRVTASGLGAAGRYTVTVTSAVTRDTTRHSVVADADGRWAASLSVPGDERLTIGLYRAGETTAYRTVIVAAG
jgi:hypothetical protein